MRKTNLMDWAGGFIGITKLIDHDEYKKNKDIEIYPSIINTQLGMILVDKNILSEIYHRTQSAANLKNEKVVFLLNELIFVLGQMDQYEVDKMKKEQKTFDYRLSFVEASYEIMYMDVFKTNNLGQRIKIARGLRKISQEELAKELNISRSTLANWETDKHKLDIDSVNAIADALEITPDMLTKKFKGLNKLDAYELMEPKYKDFKTK